MRLPTEEILILVDFDKTLATYKSGGASNKFPLGEPIPAMVERVKYWLAKGKEVRIFTARASRDNPYLTEDMANIKAWCKKHLGQELEVQNWKDFRAEAIWDDLAVSVEANTGRIVRRLDLDIDPPAKYDIESQLKEAYDKGLTDEGKELLKK